MVGDQPFEIDDHSRNNWDVAFVSMGEGWHHNHHAFPTSAKHGLTGKQFDPSYMIIKTLEKFGLAWNIKVPAEEALQKKLRVATPTSGDEDFAPQRSRSIETVPSAIPDTNDGAPIAASPLARATEDDPDRKAVA